MSSSVEADIQQQQPTGKETDTPIHEETQRIIQSIRDVIAPQAEVIRPFAEERVDGGENAEAVEDRYGSSHYWDASGMAPLNAASAAAIARLRAFKPPPSPIWDRLHVSRRAAVLLLLFADRRGDLRVVITMRAASLRSFSGHAALPGGKADTPDETAYQIARREAWEEIGLPMDDTKLPPPFRIEHLCDLPMNLARTELVVRPCVAMLHATEPPVPTGAVQLPPNEKGASSRGTVEESLIPRLDAKEVAAVFSAPFHSFLAATDEGNTLLSSHAEGQPPARDHKSLPPGNWYEGNWLQFNGKPWRAHYFHVPVHDQRVVKPSRRLSLAAEDAVDALKDAERYTVWGMTAHILVDAARIAYGEDPEFEHSRDLGDEEIIAESEKQGRLAPKPRASDAASKV